MTACTMAVDNNPVVVPESIKLKIQELLDLCAEYVLFRYIAFCLCCSMASFLSH